MVYMPDEGEAMAQLGGAMYINMGTQMPIYAETLIRTARALREEGKTWVVDPVGIGVGGLRMSVLKSFKEFKPGVVRGNASEIIALANLWGLESGIKNDGVRGVDAIVVSNHGGRVQDQCPATAEVLPEIVDAVGRDMIILVDGGIRSGVDVFKALALGADGVLIARPFVTAVYGGAEEGVACYLNKIGGELVDTMKMCGAKDLAAITPDCVRV